MNVSRFKPLANLKKTLKHRMVLPTDPSYESDRRVFNARIDHKPAAICFCETEKEVQLSVAAARNSGLKVSVRSGGGHSPCGFSVGDGSLCIDISSLCHIEIENDVKTVRVGGGAIWEDLDDKLETLSVCVPGGTSSAVGVAGLTISGGVGLLSRRYGLACDSLVAARMVCSDGSLQVANYNHNEELLWMIKGGGSLVPGVLTELTFKLHDLRQGVFGGIIVWPAEVGARVTRQALEYFNCTAPNALQVYFAYGKDQGRPLLVAAGLFIGSPEEGNKAFSPILEISEPIVCDLKERRYSQFKQELGRGLKSSQSSIWKSGIADSSILQRSNVFEQLQIAAIDAPNDSSLILLEIFNGVIQEVGWSETAFFHRDKFVSVLALAISDKVNFATDLPSHREWLNKIAKINKYFDGVYTGYVDKDLSDWRKLHFGENYTKIKYLVGKHDPDGVFEIGYDVN